MCNRDVHALNVLSYAYFKLSRLMILDHLLFFGDKSKSVVYFCLNLTLVVLIRVVSAFSLALQHQEPCINKGFYYLNNVT